MSKNLAVRHCAVTNISEGRSDVDNWNDESRFPRVMSAALCWGWGWSNISLVDV